MHNYPDKLGDVIKSASQKADVTVEALAEKVDKTERYMYRIENEGQKPSYDVLFALIRELTIPADLIFWPEKSVEDTETEEIIRMLYKCDKRSIAVIKATVKALIETAAEEQ